MYKNFILNYVNKLNKEAIYNFRNNNNLNATDQDVEIVYQYIQKYKNVFFENPEKYILMIKNEVSKNCYKEIEKYYNKYKKNI